MDVNISDGGKIKADGDIPEELAMNYEAMDEAGKEMLLRETERILQSEEGENRASTHEKIVRKY